MANEKNNALQKRLLDSLKREMSSLNMVRMAQIYNIVNGGLTGENAEIIQNAVPEIAIVGATLLEKLGSGDLKPDQVAQVDVLHSGLSAGISALVLGHDAELKSGYVYESSEDLKPGDEIKLDKWSMGLSKFRSEVTLDKVKTDLGSDDLKELGEMNSPAEFSEKVTEKLKESTKPFTIDLKTVAGLYADGGMNPVDLNPMMSDLRKGGHLTPVSVEDFENGNIPKGLPGQLNAVIGELDENGNRTAKLVVHAATAEEALEALQSAGVVHEHQAKALSKGLDGLSKDSVPELTDAFTGEAKIQYAELSEQHKYALAPLGTTKTITDFETLNNKENSYGVNEKDVEQVSNAIEKHKNGEKLTSKDLPGVAGLVASVASGVQKREALERATKKAKDAVKDMDEPAGPKHNAIKDALTTVTAVPKILVNGAAKQGAANLVASATVIGGVMTGKPLDGFVKGGQIVNDARKEVLEDTKETVGAVGRTAERVKDVVTKPFKSITSAKDANKAIEGDKVRDIIRGGIGRTIEQPDGSADLLKIKDTEPKNILDIVGTGGLSDGRKAMVADLGKISEYTGASVDPSKIADSVETIGAILAMKGADASERMQNLENEGFNKDGSVNRDNDGAENEHEAE